MASATDTIVWVGAGVGALGLVAIGVAWLLRRAEIPGGRTSGAIVAGLLAGLVLGPGVGGRVAPSIFHRAFVGAGEEQRAVAAMRERQNLDMRVVKATDVTPEYLVELSAKQAAEIAPLERAAEDARARRREVLGAIAGVLIGVHLALVGLVCAPIGRAMRATLRRGPSSDGERAFSLPDGAGAAGIMIVVALIGPILALMWVGRSPAREAIGVALAMGVPGIGAEARPRLLPAAMIGVGVGAAGAAYLVRTNAMAPAIPIGVGLLLLVGLVLAGRPRLERGARRVIGWVVAGATLPVVCALAAIRCDPQALLGSGEFWVVAIAAMLLSSDGRWVGIGWAQKLFPRGTGAGLPGARTWTGASSLVNAGAGAAQITVALALESAGVISGAALGGLLLGCVAIELSRSIRSRVGWMMDGGKGAGATQ